MHTLLNIYSEKDNEIQGMGFTTDDAAELLIKKIREAHSVVFEKPEFMELYEEMRAIEKKKREELISIGRGDAIGHYRAMDGFFIRRMGGKRNYSMEASEEFLKETIGPYEIKGLEIGNIHIDLGKLLR